MHKEIMGSLKGHLFVLVLATGIRVLHQNLPELMAKSVGEVIFAVALGLILNHFCQNKKWFEDCRPAFKFCVNKLLKFSIILLGVRISLQTILDLGSSTLLLVVFLMILSFSMAIILGKVTKTPRKIAALIGIGTSVCGNTAISATGPAIKANDDEISFAIAVNTLFGTLCVFAYPFIGQILGLDETFFGMWAGTAVNDTSQVVATGFSFSPKAGEVATTVKLVRNSLMGFVIIFTTMFFGEKENTNTSFIKRLKIPGFVIAFLVMAILNSLGVFTWMSEVSSMNIAGYISWISKFFILIALLSVGLNTKLSSFKEIGYSPLLIGFATATMVSLTSYFLILLLGLSQI
jgi:uncharacterized integral membrane protein (TIGR00698 family)